MSQVGGKFFGAAASVGRMAPASVALDGALLALAAATAAVCLRGMQRELVCAQVTRDD